MGYKLDRYIAGTMDKGVQARTMDFQGDLGLALTGYSMSQGLQQGLAPRPGMSPIPGQQDAEVISGTRLPGLRAAEGNTAQGLAGRVKVLNVFALKLPDPSNVQHSITCYAWVLTATSLGVEYFDVYLSSTWNSTYETISANIYDGFGLPSYYPAATSINYLGEALMPINNDRVAPMQSYLQAPDNQKFYASSILMSVTGPNVPTQWLFGKVTTVGDATHAPSVAFHKATGMSFGVSTSEVFACGVPSEYNLQNFTTTNRCIRVFACIGDTSNLNTYSLTLKPPTTSIFKQDIFGNGTVTLELSGVTATKDTGGTAYAFQKAALVNDPVSVTNSSYKAVLIATDKPIACIFQDGYRGESSGNNGKSNQWVDLTQNTFQPRVYPSAYQQEGVLTPTCFYNWPNFVRGTAMGPALGTTSVALMSANTGFLRSQTVYEFAYSTYNKRLNFESNVGTPVKIQTGVDDFVGLQLWSPNGGSTTHTVQSETISGAAVAVLFPIFGNYIVTADGERGYQNFINHIQYRFYYRQEGTFEWLPALFVDAAQYWFYPWGGIIAACTGAIEALPGGQSGGFNDYSPLPKDRYNCVVQYKDRAFWFSEKQINFSLRNNIFAYPGRNSVSAVAGQFKGGLVHNYPGQAEQSSRLIVFGTRETYVARFSGLPAQQNVQVSANSSGVFNIDGSDLVLDPWTSVTAFSYRSAVVAEGILYWWGPQGVFRDDGVETPTRISQDLEPNLFTLYDPSKTAEITGNYNTQTKEIEWFFTPKTAVDDEVNRSLIYNTISGNWTPGRYTNQIDWLTSMTIDTNLPTSGFREIVGSRLSGASTVQRAYFFDQRNRSGDMCPTRDWILKAISAPSTGIRRLTLAAGYDATNFAAIAVGDLIAMQQTADYTNNGASTASDLIATVNAINTGAGTIDINLPTGATLSPTNLQYFNYAPFWHLGAHGLSRGNNGIAYSLETQYWMPGGLGYYAFWLYLYLVAKMRLWFCDEDLGWTVSYRTPTSEAYISDVIPFADNSDGNFQVYHPLRPGDDNQEGQGLKLKISGYHIGNEWVLQYLEAHAQQFTGDGDPLKRFEG